MSFSANRSAYCPRPSFSSQSATCCIAAAPRSIGLHPPASARLSDKSPTQYTHPPTGRLQSTFQSFATPLAALARAAHMRSDNRPRRSFSLRPHQRPWQPQTRAAAPGSSPILIGGRARSASRRVGPRGPMNTPAGRRGRPCVRAGGGHPKVLHLENSPAAPRTPRCEAPVAFARAELEEG